MARYCMNKNAQANGDREVHKAGCIKMPNPENRFDLGEHVSCQTAVAKAKQYYSLADGCFYCSRECHTR